MRSFALFFIAATSILLASHSVALACTVTFPDGALYPDIDCDGLVDFDEIGNPVDNCPTIVNGNCDDNPAVCNIDGSLDISGRDTLDEFELRAGLQADWNHNGIGDACEDTDFDKITDYRDNCKTVFNPDQNPGACTDTDTDGVEDPVDNCPKAYNSRQEDSDGDGVGDACDICALVYNPVLAIGEQDAKPCTQPGSALTPATSIGPAPNPGVSPLEAPMYWRGAGGCSLIPSASAAPWTALALLIPLGLAAIRRHQ